MGLASVTGKMLKAAAKDNSRVMAGKLGNVSEAVATAFRNGSKMASEAAEAGYTKGINKYAKIFADDYADAATKWQMRANKLHDKAAGRMTPAVISNSGSDTVNKAIRNVEKASNDIGNIGKNASNGIGKNAFVGGTIGAASGAGIGGITGLVSGADEDDMKSMVLMGAITGGAGGAIVGGASKMVRNKAVSGSAFKQIAEDIAANGGSNAAVGGGVNGFFEKAKNGITGGASNIATKLDDVGENISNKITKKAGTKAENAWLQDKLDRGYGLADLLDDGTIMGNAMNSDRKKAVTDAVDRITRKANTIGGAAQGAIIGSAGGALIGGISGGIDEDETFIGGAIKGGFIGGTLGGIGGGASGYFNNNARILSNTTSNVKSLIS